MLEAVRGNTHANNPVGRWCKMFDAFCYWLLFINHGVACWVTGIGTSGWALLGPLWVVLQLCSMVCSFLMLLGPLLLQLCWALAWTIPRLLVKSVVATLMGGSIPTCLTIRYLESERMGAGVLKLMLAACSIAALRGLLWFALGLLGLQGWVTYAVPGNLLGRIVSLAFESVKRIWVGMMWRPYILTHFGASVPLAYLCFNGDRVGDCNCVLFLLQVLITWGNVAVVCSLFLSLTHYAISPYLTLSLPSFCRRQQQQQQHQHHHQQQQQQRPRRLWWRSAVVGVAPVLAHVMISHMGLWEVVDAPLSIVVLACVATGGIVLQCLFASPLPDTIVALEEPIVTVLATALRLVANTLILTYHLLFKLPMSTLAALGLFAASRDEAVLKLLLSAGKAVRHVAAGAWRYALTRFMPLGASKFFVEFVCDDARCDDYDYDCQEDWGASCDYYKSLHGGALWAREHMPYTFWFGCLLFCCFLLVTLRARDLASGASGSSSNSRGW